MAEESTKTADAPETSTLREDVKLDIDEDILAARCVLDVLYAAQTVGKTGTVSDQTSNLTGNPQWQIRWVHGDTPHAVVSIEDEDVADTVQDLFTAMDHTATWNSDNDLVVEFDR